MNNQQGYVFINKEGKFVLVAPNTGFGSGHRVEFVADINQATVFTNKNGYYGTLLSADSRTNLVKYCQPLKAMATRVVSLENWSEKDGQAS